MSFAIGLIVGSMIGACLGLLVAGLLRVAAKGDAMREVRPGGAARSELLE
jgi:hypothetical protein